jgi:hypothetical protein
MTRGNMSLFKMALLICPSYVVDLSLTKYPSQINVLLIMDCRDLIHKNYEN